MMHNQHRIRKTVVNNELMTRNNSYTPVLHYLETSFYKLLFNMYVRNCCNDERAQKSVKRSKTFRDLLLDIFYFQID